MIYRTTSSQAVLARVSRVFKPDSPGWQNDALMWMAEGISLIGYFTGVFKKSTGNEDDDSALNVKSHRVKMPCDLESINQIEYKGYPLPYNTDNTLAGQVGVPKTAMTSTPFSVVDILPGLSESVGYINSSPLVTNSSRSTGDYYTLNPDYIITSFETGLIKLHYNAYYRDSDGFPLIPDLEEMIIALSWYIMSLMLLGGYKHPVLNYQLANAEWMKYRELAESKAGFPSVDKALHLARGWGRMIPDITLPDNFFVTDLAPYT